MIPCDLALFKRTVSSPKRLKREVRIMTKFFTVATSIYSHMDLHSTKIKH